MFQLAGAAIGLYVYSRTKIRALGWLWAYEFLELLSGSIGLYMARNGIYNHLFYHYFTLLTQFSIFQFFMQILKSDKQIRRLKVAYIISIFLFIAFDIAPLMEEIKMLFDFISLFMIFSCVIMLNERIHDHGGLAFRDDPESIIAMILAVTFSVSLFASTASYSIIYLGFPRKYEAIFVIIIGLAIIFKYGLISRQLWKLR